MGIVSIEEAVLSFVRRVKNDPDSSDLFRTALHELELLLDPQLAQGDTAAVQSDPAAAPPVDPSPVGAPPAQDGQGGDPSAQPAEPAADPAAQPPEPAQDA